MSRAALPRATLARLAPSRADLEDAARQFLVIGSALTLILAPSLLQV